MKLELLTFIKNHSNWEELLSGAPYFLKIKRDNGYILFKYDQLNSDFSIPLVQEARGIIFRESDWNLVCFPFVKFFNIGEENACELDLSSIRVQEKIDRLSNKIMVG